MDLWCSFREIYPKKDIIPSHHLQQKTHPNANRWRCCWRTPSCMFLPAEPWIFQGTLWGNLDDWWMTLIFCGIKPWQKRHGMIIYYHVQCTSCTHPETKHSHTSSQIVFLGIFFGGFKNMSWYLDVGCLLKPRILVHACWKRSKTITCPFLNFPSVHSAPATQQPTCFLNFRLSVVSSAVTTRLGCLSTLEGRRPFCLPPKNKSPWSITRWWQLKYFLCSPFFCKDDPSLTNIFFKWVGSTTK